MLQGGSRVHFAQPLAKFSELVSLRQTNAAFLGCLETFEPIQAAAERGTAQPLSPRAVFSWAGSPALRPAPAGVRGCGTAPVADGRYRSRILQRQYRLASRLSCAR